MNLLHNTTVITSLNVNPYREVLRVCCLKTKASIVFLKPLGIYTSYYSFLYLGQILQIAGNFRKQYFYKYKNVIRN